MREDETIQGECTDEGHLDLDVEALEVELGAGDLQLTLTDENGCSATASTNESDHDVMVEGCDAICDGALAELDVSACADDWEEEEPSRPECSIGEQPPIDCARAGDPTMSYLFGCGYTWVREQYADSRRDTIIDEDSMVVFREWSDPLSSTNPEGCISGEIPECDEFPAPEDRWRDDAFAMGCPVDGMGGMGGMGGGGPD